MSNKMSLLKSIWSQDVEVIEICSNYFCSPGSPIFFIVIGLSQLLYADDDVNNKVTSVLQVPWKSLSLV